MSIRRGFAAWISVLVAVGVACGDNTTPPLAQCSGSAYDPACGSAWPSTLCTTGTCAPGTSGSGSGMCGDGLIEPPETCDGTAPVGCSIFGDSLGETSCTACAIDASSCKAPGWLAIAPGVEGATALWASSAHDLWALAGSAYHFDGSAWTALAFGADAVWGFAANDVFFASGSTMRHFDGTSISLLPGPSQSFAEVDRLWGTSGSDLYAALGMNGLSHWDGTSWSGLTTGASFVDDVWGSGGQLWAIGDYDVLHFDGSVWSPQSIAPGFVPNRLTGCGTSVFVIGYDGTKNVLARWDGTQWTLLPMTARVLGVPDLACTSAGELFAAGWASPSPTALAAIWYDGALTFDVELESQPQGNGVTHSPVWGSLHDDAWISGHHARASWATGGGYAGRMWRGPHDMWSVMGNAVARDGKVVYTAGAPLRAISGFGDELVIAVGDGGTVVAFDGTTWSTLAAPTSVNLHAVWVRSSTEVDIVGDYQMLRYDGAAWTATTLGTIGRALWGSGSADLYLAGAAGRVDHFDGTSWKEIRPGAFLAPELTGIWATGPDDIFVVGGSNTVLHWNGIGWASLLTVAIGDATSVHGTASDDVFVASAGGTVYRWDGHLLAAVGSQSTNPYDDDVQVWATAGAVYFTGGLWDGRVLVR